MSKLTQTGRALLLTVAVAALGACSIAPPLTAQETEIKTSLNESQFMPSSREMRDNIETQELFAQAAFWSHEYELNPSDLESAIKLSAVIRKLGNPQRAVEITQTTRALYPRDPYLTAEYIAALIASERGLDAMQPLDQALAISPGYARLWSLKGAALDQQEQYDLARKHYARALQITPHDPNILANVGLSYALEGDAATGETWLRRAAAMPGAGKSVQQNLRLVLQLQGKTEEANKMASLSGHSAKYPAPPTAAHQPLVQKETMQRPTQPNMQRRLGPPTTLTPYGQSNGTANSAPPAQWSPQGARQGSPQASARQAPPNGQPQFRSSADAVRAAAAASAARGKTRTEVVTQEQINAQQDVLAQIAGSLNKSAPATAAGPRRSLQSGAAPNYGPQAQQQQAAPPQQASGYPTMMGGPIPPQTSQPRTAPQTRSAARRRR